MLQEPGFWVGLTALGTIIYLANTFADWKELFGGRDASKDKRRKSQ